MQKPKTKIESYKINKLLDRPTNALKPAPVAHCTIGKNLRKINLIYRLMENQIGRSNPKLFKDIETEMQDSQSSKSRHLIHTILTNKMINYCAPIRGEKSLVPQILLKIRIYQQIYLQQNEYELSRQFAQPDLEIQVTLRVSLVQYQNRKFNIMQKIPRANSNTSRGLKMEEKAVRTYRNFENHGVSYKKHDIEGVIFELPEYYVPLKLIGTGAYGAVAIAIDKRFPENQREKNMVAIKKMTNAFEHKIYARRVLRQLKLLRLLKHETIVELKTIILPKNRQQFQDIYVVFELMESDVANIVKRGADQLSEQHAKYILYQTLKGLKYMHSSKIVHRDLKTRNLLIDSSCQVKICDFGLSRSVDQSARRTSELTDYITTRWYRAPQLLMGQTQYTPAVDMWSVGCIMAELLLKQAFLRGKDTEDQLKIICEIVDLSNGSSFKNKKPAQFQELSKLMNKNKASAGVLDRIFRNFSPDCRDLLKKLLQIDSDLRISASEALNHPYFSEIHEEIDIEEYERVNPLQFEFDQLKLTTEQLKDLIYQEILLYHFPQNSKAYFLRLNNGLSVINHVVSGQKLQPYSFKVDNQEDLQQ